MKILIRNTIMTQAAYFSRVNFVCSLLFGDSSTPVLPKGHIKDTGHSAKSAGGRLHLLTHIHILNRMKSKWAD